MPKIVNHPKMNFNEIEVKRGTEGPRHDPYAWTEITHFGRNGLTTFHYGLAEWIDLNGVRHESPNAALMFETTTGLNPYRAERLAYELPYRRHAAKCDGREFKHQSGYPGETFEICTKCGNVVDSQFDISAVE